MELIHYDYNWLGIGGPTEFDGWEEDEEFEEKVQKRVAIKIVKKKFSGQFRALS